MVSSMNIHATVERAEPNGANLQRFLIMRIGRPVHAAEAIGGRSVPANRDHPPLSATRSWGKRECAGCDAQTGQHLLPAQNLLLAEAQPGSILPSAVLRSHLQISAYI